MFRFSKIRVIYCKLVVTKISSEHFSSILGGNVSSLGNGSIRGSCDFKNGSCVWRNVTGQNSTRQFQDTTTRFNISG